MSYKERFDENNVDLQSILDTVNALPEAGSGGSDGTNSATVTIESPDHISVFFNYYDVSDNNFKFMGTHSMDDITISNVSTASICVLSVPSANPDANIICQSTGRVTTVALFDKKVVSVYVMGDGTVTVRDATYADQ